MSNDPLTTLALSREMLNSTILTSSGTLIKSTGLCNILDLLAAFAPFNFPIIGTNGDDVLSTQAEGDSIFGLGGMDQLSSAFNRTLLFGGRDADTLTTTVVMPASDEATQGLAFQSGGKGDDTLNASVSYAATTAPERTEGDRSILIIQDGGDGSDQITTRASGNPISLASIDIQTFVFGGKGQDIIDVVSDGRGSLFDSIVSNVVDGGAGADRITVTAQSEFNASLGEASNKVSGGDGDDFVNATAIAQSEFNRLASNIVDGGNGNDEVHVTNQVNSNSGTPTSIMEVRGGDGNDVLTGVGRTTLAAIFATDSAHFDGGRGDDVVSLDTLTQGFTVSSHNLVEGGNGADNLTSRLEALALGGFPGLNRPSLEASNTLDGGNGNDTLNATLVVAPDASQSPDSTAANWLSGGNGDDQLTAYAEFALQLPANLLSNHLDGGNGKDVLTATIAANSQGTSFLSGGAGDDVLTVFGGTNNELHGGSGRDTLVSGVGDDIMDGGAGADRFVFAPPNGNDTITALTHGDKIDLTAFATSGIHAFADLNIELVGADSVIRFDVADTITVLDNQQLAANDFLFA